MTHFVYAIVSDLTDGSYVGCTATPTARWSNHRTQARRSSNPLYVEMRRLGRDNFRMEILTEHQCEREALAAEMAEIARRVGTDRPVYNRHICQTVLLPVIRRLFGDHVRPGDVFGWIQDTDRSSLQYFRDLYAPQKKTKRKAK